MHCNKLWMTALLECLKIVVLVCQQQLYSLCFDACLWLGKEILTITNYIHPIHGYTSCSSNF